MSSNNHQHEQLVHAAIGQVAFLLCIAALSWFYTYPQYTSLVKSVSAANTAIEKYKETEKKGLSYEDLVPLLTANGKKEELLAVIKSEPAETKTAITNPTSDPYLTWLSDIVNNSNGEDGDKKKLVLKKARLNSILPTLSPISNNVSEDAVSMRKYIGFVEKNIFKQFEISSTTPLGIQNIKYGKKGSEMPETVGSFDTEVSFKTSNDNIMKLIDYVNQLGKPTILTDTGVIVIGSGTRVPEVMSNPLAMIDSFSIEKALDSNRPNDENTGRMTIRFFIRGSSETDMVFLSESIKSRREMLGKNIKSSIDRCGNDDTCSIKPGLETLAKKYNEFIRASNSQTAKISGIEGIYRINAELDSIMALEKELNNLTGK